MRWRRAVFPLLLLMIAVVIPFSLGTGVVMALLVQVFAFGAFAMSYDLLIGYTGIVSFGHAMFFGTGAYAMAIFLTRGTGSTTSFIEGLLVAAIAAAVLSLLVAFISLRVKDAYFAMITLAVGQVFAVLAGSQGLRPLTGGNDGLSVLLPNWLGNDAEVYYFCLVYLVLIVVFLRRFVHSPVGDVLRGIRENESRAVDIGLPVFRFKTLAFVLSGTIAALSGAVYAVAQSFVSTSVYDVSTVSLNVLLMVIIGGVGTLYGGLLGALILLAAETVFTNLSGQYAIFQNYLIIFGVLYIVVVRFMPKGILGTVTKWGGKAEWRTRPRSKSSQI